MIDSKTGFVLIKKVDAQEISTEGSDPILYHIEATMCLRSVGVTGDYGAINDD